MEHFLLNCPRCSQAEFWKTADARLKCRKCRYSFTFQQNSFNISNETLKKIVSEFVLEHSIKIIIERVDISKYKLLKILTTLRKLLTNPESQKKFEKTTTPIIGIAYCEGKFFAEIVRNFDIRTFKYSLRKKVLPPANLFKYAGLIFNGSLHRISIREKHKYRITLLESFWGFLKKKLAAKGGIHKENLPLYLGEYSWRYNHRKLTLSMQEEYLFNLLSQYHHNPNN